MAEVTPFATEGGVVGGPGAANATAPAPIPVGLDAYRQWDRWPYLRILARTYLRSTYDRGGGNEDADAGHFLYQRADDWNVTLDVAGAGVLCFVRFNHWHGSPWHFEVDGVDHVIQETNTAESLHPVARAVFQPETAFPPPLAFTWATTHGADLSWVPVPFEHSFQLAYGRTHYATGYYIYQQFVPGAALSRPIESWTEAPPDPAVLALIRRAGSDLVPVPDSDEGRRLGMKQTDRAIAVPPGGTVELANLTTAPAMLRALELSAPREQAVALGRARLQITWDGLPQPSVDAPVALLFGAGTLYNRDNAEYLVKAFPVWIRFDRSRVHLACFFPMPFFRSARVTLTNTGTAPLDVTCSARYAPFHDPPDQVGYFHATYRDHPHPVPGQDLVWLDTRTTEGGGDWSGQIVGTSFVFSDRAVLNTLEGDPRFFFDDSQTPQAQGTGTEEWGGGGDYWGGRTMTLPFAGHPTGARNAAAAKCDEDKVESAYRFLLGDLMPFGERAVIRFEHGGRDQSTEHYRTVVFWYGRHRPSLVRTDVLKIGDSASEQAHAYVSRSASTPYSITSRYEWGVDTLDGREIFPPETDSGRTMTGVSEFTVALRRDNLGVMLRRKLDYRFPNQRAEVSVADAAGRWQPAGVWYLAGSNTCVYSHPKPELGATQHTVETSNRRFRDDEFLLPQWLTRGRRAIRVRVKFTPVRIPLVPGRPLDELAWSEIRYDAYCFVMPR